jgi:hypothetical protein
MTAGSEKSQQEAAALAKRMAPVMAELTELSAQKAAAELYKRKIASATGGKWYAATVVGQQAARAGRSADRPRSCRRGPRARESMDKEEERERLRCGTSRHAPVWFCRPVLVVRI